MSGPKTTWEELASLGWYKQQVYDALQNRRGNTMDGFGDMALNERFANDYSWYSYNTTIGTPRLAGNSVDNINSEKEVWTYDNTENSEDYGPITRSETWTDSETASLSITNKASMKLESSVTIASVASTSLAIEISTEATKSESKTSSKENSQKFDITVRAGEKVIIYQEKVTTIGKSTYYLDFGLSSNSLIATKGEKYDGHYYWGFNLNGVLGSPKGTMTFTGNSTTTYFNYKVVRIKAPESAIMVSAVPAADKGEEEPEEVKA
ncbi:cytolysin [Cylindrobasidium torrendii FP15055 ss-10]|uniref:Cytolysin n=1 Tax=Cylindrobasidium torrendii FP15055 ss-10 TaxID=1314674 RepID=A0A0D7AVA3_9AGAR|nr:cytolysin [Cylindrobasidium torrendii FP15055 ss-10]